MTNESLEDQLFKYHLDTFTDYLPVESMVEGGLYIICGKDAYVGVWRESEKGFEVARLDGSWSLSTEYHRDVKTLSVFEMYLPGSAKPIKFIGNLDASNEENLLEFLIQLEIDNPIVPGINTIAKNIESAQRFADHLSGKKRFKPPIDKLLLMIEELNKQKE